MKKFLHDPRLRLSILASIALLSSLGHLSKSFTLWQLGKATASSPDTHILTEMGDLLYWSGTLVVNFTDGTQSHEWLQQKGAFDYFGNSHLVMIAYGFMLAVQPLMPDQTLSKYMVHRLLCKNSAFQQKVGLRFSPSKADVNIQFKNWGGRPRSLKYEISCAH